MCTKQYYTSHVITLGKNGVDSGNGLSFGIKSLDQILYTIYDKDSNNTESNLKNWLSHWFQESIR